MDLLPFDREMPCPACGIQMTIVGLCREDHHTGLGADDSAASPGPAASGAEHLLVRCPGCGWEAFMETASQAAARVPVEVPRELRGFIKDGRLLELPVRHGRRLEALGYIAGRAFEPDRVYPEPEVNQRLAVWHPDVASLRRFLVDEGFMRRGGGRYELRPVVEWPIAGHPAS
ncbi:MAG TPA: DUF2087 domain-containing protein [Candidatus Limnocylindrales bacterium]|nr:DUF2087 domain-containing protein [Candidatus Limnocylindrales bacterium]